MQLRELVDLEWQLHRDTELEGPDLRDRDLRVGEFLLARESLEAHVARSQLQERGFREKLSLGWLERVRSNKEPLPGARVQQGFEIVGWILVAFGLLAGVGSARAFLAYDGKTPVNVLAFVAFFVGLQLLLLLLLVFVLLRKKSTGTGGLHRLLARLTRARIVDRLLGKQVRSLGDVLDELRRRRASFSDAERWLVFSLAQRFGMSFNIGALLTCLYLVTFSDLVFAWSTTLATDATTIHGIVHWISLPWAWLGEWAVPSEEVVSASRWVRLTRTFAGDGTLGSAVPLAAKWWRFLVVGLITYGLLPRLIAWLIGTRAYRRALRAVPLDHAGFQELYDRLLPPSLGWHGPAPSAVRGDAPEGADPAASAVLGTDVPVALVLWGRLADRREDLTTRIAHRHPVKVCHVAGGLDLRGDQKTCAALASELPDHVLVVFEAGQQPTREVLDFLTDVRQSIGERTPLLVCLVVEGDGGHFHDATEPEIAIWQRSVRATGDAYLRVHRIGGPA